ncbi:hypothetical protein GCM10022237_25240 [Nocardioides ginsengisoli]|uniref:FadR/GntR family transcriptional regulator n=1 Tax=Nocardioides ginsengisoli TaxID=363868 RepID=A0ABW3W5K3_9ACTN
MTKRAALDSTRLHEQLARELARDIVARRLPENAVVPSAEDLASSYGVSRTVAREALQALATAGLVTVRHGKRTLVAPLSEWRFLEDLVKQAIAREQLAAGLANDLMETRMALEVAAAKLCAERADDEHFEQLERHARACLDSYENGTLNPSSPQAVADDLHFHRLIAEGSGNQVLVHLVTDIRRELAPTWAIDAMTVPDAIRVWQEHLEIAKILATRDQVKVESVLREHMRHTVDTTIRRALPVQEQDSIDRRWPDSEEAAGTSAST